MSKDIQITVVTTSYNGSKYIKNAIESVLNQKFKYFEYIIVDDCSSDETFKICKEFEQKDPRIKVVKNEKNIERSASRNKAINIANGKYIAFLDDDDIRCDGNKLKKQFEFLGKNPNYGLVGTNFTFVDDDYKETGKELVFRQSDKEIRNSFLKTNSFIFSTILARKDKIQEVGGFDNTQFLAEDYELRLKIGKISKLHNLKDKCILYMDRTNNTSNNLKNKFKINLKGLMFCIKYHKYYPRFYINLLSKLMSLIVPAKVYERKTKRMSD